MHNHTFKTKSISGPQGFRLLSSGLLLGWGMGDGRQVSKQCCNIFLLNLEASFFINHSPACSRVVFFFLLDSNVPKKADSISVCQLNGCLNGGTDAWGIFIVIFHDIFLGASLLALVTVDCNFLLDTVLSVFPSSLVDFPSSAHPHFQASGWGWGGGDTLIGESNRSQSFHLCVEETQH